MIQALGSSLIGTRRQSRWPVVRRDLLLDLVAERTSRRTPPSAGSAELPTGVWCHRHQVVAGRQFAWLYGRSGCLLPLRRLACARRWLSPLISTMWQWCTSRSTAATVIELLGKISSQAVNG